MEMDKERGVNQYSIYRHSDGEVEAVKHGWSWPGFFFIWFWALCKKIWVAGIAAFVGLIAIGAIFAEDRPHTGVSVGEVVMVTVLIGLGVFFGLKGNRLREKNLRSRGFTLDETTSAASPDAAIALFWEKREKPDDHAA